METVLFENVKKLYDHGLFECVIKPASLLSTILKNDRLVATFEMEYEVLLYLSVANYNEHNYRAACKQLESAVLMRKTAARFKVNFLSSIENSYPDFTDAELRYRIADCYRKLGDHNMAISTIQAVPTQMRTPRLNMLLARLLHNYRTNGRQEAILAYKDVLRECPMSMTAIDGLLELQVDGSEVNAMVVNASTEGKNVDWLSSWIKGNAQMYSRQHLEAAKTFQQLNDHTTLHKNEQLLTQIGRCLYYYGSYHQAEQYLSTAAMINPDNMEARSALVVVYESCNQKKSDIFDQLFTQFNGNNRSTDFNASHWFVLAQQLYMNAKFERALCFTERSLDLEHRNIEALILRGKILRVLSRPKEAVAAFRTAHSVAPHRFEIYKGLFHCYVSLKRIKEAQNICSLTVRNFRTSPRSYTMFGHTLFHSSNQEVKKSARRFVEKSLELDQHYTPAVSLMAQIYYHEGAVKEAITLLKQHLASYPHPKLFTKLGEMLSAQKDLNGALHYFTMALSLEPTCQHALDGINALGQVARTSSSQKQNTDNGASTSGGGGGGGGSNNIGETNAATLSTPCGTPNHEWLLECDENSHDAVELSSPAVPQEDAESDAFSEPFWQDVDEEVTD